MTLDEWTDTIATMTPRQREAVGYALIAARTMAMECTHKAIEDNDPIVCFEYGPHPVDGALTYDQDMATQAVGALYPGSTAAH